MKKTSALSLLIALVALGGLLASCGGSDDSSTDSTAASEQTTTQSTPTTANDEGGGGAKDQGGKGSGSSSDSSGGSGKNEEKPASLATNPDSISGAIVTSTGAVQTLPPSSASQEKAMENSYSSIKAFGNESTGSEATDITYALVQYLTAKANGDSATACARLYSVLRDNIAKLAEKAKDPSIQGGGCPAAYGALMQKTSKSDSKEAAKIDVASVRRGEGNRAFVIYKTPNTLSADMPMYLEAGVWTVGAIEAYVLTPEELAENQG